MSFEPRYFIGDLDLTAEPFLVLQGEDRGFPANVAEAVDSLLQDGTIVSSSRSDNRTMSYTVYIEEADLAACAAAETTLIAECDKQRNTFTVEPGDHVSASTVFDIFRTQARFVYDPDAEQAGLRRYDLTFTALPFGRSKSETVYPAITAAGSPSTVVIADGTSATNWSGDSAVTASGGTLRQTGPLTASGGTVGSGAFYQASRNFIYTPGVALDFSVTTYLYVDYVTVTGGTSATTKVRVFADGVEMTTIATETLAAGVYRKWFLISDSSVASLKVLASSVNFYKNGTTPPTTATFQIDNVTRTNQQPGASVSPKQSLRSLTLDGSARTEGSIHVSHATAALGDVIVYSTPALADGYTPDLNRWRITGGSTATRSANSTAVTGTSSTLVDGGVTGTNSFLVPAAILPSGSYALMARVRSTNPAGSPGTVRVTAQTEMGSSIIASSGAAISSATTTLSGTLWSIVPITVLPLPLVDLPESTSAVLRFSVLCGIGQTVEIDEFWAFYLGEDAALTQVAAGEGVPSSGSICNHLWIDSPSVDQPQPQVRLGTTADGGDSFHAGIKAASWGMHRLTPGQNNLYVVTAGVANAAAEVRCFNRWHTHAEN